MCKIERQSEYILDQINGAMYLYSCLTALGELYIALQYSAAILRSTHFEVGLWYLQTLEVKCFEPTIL